MGDTGHSDARVARRRSDVRGPAGGVDATAGLDGVEMAQLAPPRKLEDRYSNLFEELRRPARAMVRRAFGSAFSDEQVEDLYAGAWLSTIAAFRRNPRELDDEELRRYLLTAVANQASREMRRRGRKPTLPIELAAAAADPGNGPDETVAGAEQARIARDVLGTLPARRRAVMVFRYGWGLEPEEVRGLIGGLSPRAYRREVERGVAEVARKLRMVEDGDWCESREPLLRAVAAGTAAEEDESQARRHLRHCRSCAGFLGRLQAQLHDLGGSVALLGGAGAGGGGLAERGLAALDRGREAIASAVGRGTDGAGEAATQLAAAGGGRGAGVAGAGAMAKLAGLGAGAKAVAACIGTGAAATACAAAGIVPVIDLDRDRAPGPAREIAADTRSDDAERHLQLSAVTAPPPSDAQGTAEPAGDPPAEPARPVPAPEPQPATEPMPPPEPAPTVQEFEPAPAPALAPPSPSPGPAAGASGDEAGSRSGADFGP